MNDFTSSLTLSVITTSVVMMHRSDIIEDLKWDCIPSTFHAYSWGASNIRDTSVFFYCKNDGPTI
jgi:hypothetical protein